LISAIRRAFGNDLTIEPWDKSCDPPNDSDITNGRQQVSILANIIRSEMKIPSTEAELSQFFSHAVAWAQGMLSRHLQFASSEKGIAHGRPNAAEPDYN
jgi:hypothetical protein